MKKSNFHREGWDDAFKEMAENRDDELVWQKDGMEIKSNLKRIRDSIEFNIDSIRDFIDEDKK